jgi:menaquinone-dependent protoporphyrinogen oxidase
MNTTILVAFATKSGSTREVADAVAGTLAERGLRVEVRPAAEVEDLEPFAGVVLGTALYMGRAHRDARRFLRRHRAALAGLPVAVFGMGPGSLRDKDVAGSRSQLVRALGHVPELAPGRIAIFGGVVKPETLRFPFNRMPAADARDWDAIEAWAADVADLMGGRGAPVMSPA